MLKDNSTQTAFVASVITFLSGFTLSDWAAICGIIFGLATLLMSWYYKQKDYKLKELAIKNQLTIQGLWKDE